MSPHPSFPEHTPVTVLKLPNIDSEGPREDGEQTLAN